jgi:hypothetical protein
MTSNVSLKPFPYDITVYWILSCFRPPPSTPERQWTDECTLEHEARLQMISPTGQRERIAERAANYAPVLPPLPPLPFPVPVQQPGRQPQGDPFAGPAGPSLDRHFSDQPPVLSP